MKDSVHEKIRGQAESSGIDFRFVFFVRAYRETFPPMMFEVIQNVYITV